MSVVKKILLGGATTGLAVSLLLPVSQDFGWPQPSVVEAGIRPAFSKPWKNKFGKSKPNVQVYDLPDDAKPVTDADRYSNHRDSSVAQELDHLYQQEDKSSSQTADESIQSHVESSSPQKSSNPFARFMNRIIGRKSTPERNQFRNDPTENAPANIPELYVPEEKMVKTIAPERDSAPTAEIILPPTPQPNLLPDVEMTETERLKPALTEGVSVSTSDDPYPLPPPPMPAPLPTAVVKTEQRKAQPAFIPPLPGTGDEIVVVKPEVPEVEQEVQAVSPAAPQMEAALVVEEPAPQVAPEPESEPVHSGTARIELEPQQIVTHVQPPVESPALTTEVAEEETYTSVTEPAAMPESGSSEVEVSPDGFEYNPLPTQTARIDRPTEEKAKKDIPPAPSAVSAPPLPVKEYAAKALSEPSKASAQYGGWRSRVSVKAAREPNTLNIPASAKPAEIPKQDYAPESSSSQSKYQRIAARGERAGFKGFCPVYLRDSLELVDASPSYRSEFEGELYYFSSLEALETFEADPLRYIPAYGGLDLVKYLEQGSEEQGRLDYAVWYQDRLFLFASQYSLEVFRAEPTRFVEE